MEMQEEKTIHQLQSEVHFWSEKIASERKRLVEVSKEEKVPCCKSGIHAHLERPIAEKSSYVEAEKEVATMFKVPLR